MQDVSPTQATAPPPEPPRPPSGTRGRVSKFVIPEVIFGVGTLAEADAALKAHLGSWEYAFAMGASRDGGGEHPRHAATRARTAELTTRVKDLRARLAEHEL